MKRSFDLCKSKRSSDSPQLLRRTADLGHVLTIYTVRAHVRRFGGTAIDEKFVAEMTAQRQCEHTD